MPSRCIDKETCANLYTQVIRQAVEDWESCVKNHWKGRREIRFTCGGMLQGRKDLANWIKEFSPQYGRIFRLSAERMAEEMAEEYKRRYKAMREAEELYAECELYPYWNTKGLRKKRAEIIQEVEYEIRVAKEAAMRRGTRHG